MPQIKTKFSSSKSSDNINKIEDGPYHGFGYFKKIHVEKVGRSYFGGALRVHVLVCHTFIISCNFDRNVH